MSPIDGYTSVVRTDGELEVRVPWGHVGCRWVALGKVQHFSDQSLWRIVVPDVVSWHGRLYHTVLESPNRRKVVELAVRYAREQRFIP